MEATRNSNESIVNSAEALMVVAQAVEDKAEKTFSTNCRFCDALHSAMNAPNIPQQRKGNRD